MTNSATPRRAVVSLRLDPETLARVSAQASEQGVTRTAQIERYIVDGMDRDRYPQLSFRYRDRVRIPMVAGRRLQVRHVVEMVDGCEGDTAAAAAEYRLPITTVDACLAYYTEHKAEIDAWIAQDLDASDDAFQAWVAERGLAEPA
ncbi:MAG: hypothetical protein ACR2J9_04670 [Gaiellales bacterium]